MDTGLLGGQRGRHRNLGWCKGYRDSFCVNKLELTLTVFVSVAGIVGMCVCVCGSGAESEVG